MGLRVLRCFFLVHFSSSLLFDLNSIACDDFMPETKDIKNIL